MWILDAIVNIWLTWLLSEHQENTEELQELNVDKYAALIDFQKKDR